MSGRFTTSACAAAMTLALAACQQAPQLGPHVSAPPPTGPKIEITSASVDAARRVVVSVQITRDGAPLGLQAARALVPAWTLAALSPDPVNPGTALPAWRVPALTGADRPGAETTGSWVEKGGGEFTYAFAMPLPPEQPLSETLRVGVFLAGAPGTALTTSTLDFVPNGAILTGRALVLDDACANCHGTLRAHGGSRSGTRICVTCHTYQHADGETVDPAAGAGATPATDPNPLEFGRLVHRIHRGKNLPTLYTASSAAEAPPIGATSPKPFFPGRTENGVLVNSPVVGRKFSVIGAESRERIFGQVVARTDNGQAAKVVARGVTFPFDYRDCKTCHEGAAQEAAIGTEISRRSCQGCHPDVWFGVGAPPDEVHLAHSGGPQADDTGCAKCHVSRPGDPADYVDVAQAHVPPAKSPRFNRPTIEIVEVRNARPGQSPTIVFTVSDRDGQLLSLTAPTPELDASSPVPRGAFSYMEATIAGPADPDFRSLGATSLPVNELVPLTIASDSGGRFSYTFQAKLPDDAGGTWLVAMNARRQAYTLLWDATNNAFAWPFTGESLYEPADTPSVWIDLAAGGTGGGSPAPRRRIVDEAKCNLCHRRLAYHGQMRTSVEACAACHAPDATDWHARPKGLSGDTDLAKTYDGVEERSIHFKVMIHRIHTGGRSGPAELSSLRPYVSYGRYGSFRFRDMGGFPGDLQRCTLCHLDGTYRVESVPIDSPPTLANETATIRHSASSAHGAAEPATPPISAACTSCHATAYAISHAARQTGNGKEACVSCHGVMGAQSVDKVHALPIPVVAPTP